MKYSSLSQRLVAYTLYASSSIAALSGATAAAIAIANPPKYTEPQECLSIIA